jgi:hypothetical protein
MAGFLFPTCVGMNRTPYSPPTGDQAVPHVRGDEPVANSLGRHWTGRGHRGNCGGPPLRPVLRDPVQANCGQAFVGPRPMEKAWHFNIQFVENRTRGYQKQGLSARFPKYGDIRIR